MRDALSIFDQVVSFTGGNITYKSVIDNLNVCLLYTSRPRSNRWWDSGR